MRNEGQSEKDSEQQQGLLGKQRNEQEETSKGKRAFKDASPHMSPRETAWTACMHCQSSNWPIRMAPSASVLF